MRMHGKRTTMLKKVSTLALAGVLAISMFGCSTANTAAEQAKDEGADSSSTSEPDLTFSKRDLDPSYDASSATKIALAGTSATIEGEGASVEGSIITLNSATTYIVSGDLANGQILVNAGDEDKLQIVLDGASIHNETGPAIMIDNADKCFITLADGSVNSISDGTAYELADDDNSDAAIFSRDDLTINGSGALNVEGNYQHAVVSKDDLVITGGTMDIHSAQDAFQGKDALKIAGGTLTVEAGDDAFHSELLFYVKDASIDIVTCYEGYEAEKVIIDGGDHTIYATDDAINASVSEDTVAQSDSQAGVTSGDMGDMGDMGGDRNPDDFQMPDNATGSTPFGKMGDADKIPDSATPPQLQGSGEQTTNASPPDIDATNQSSPDGSEIPTLSGTTPPNRGGAGNANSENGNTPEPPSDANAQSGTFEDGDTSMMQRGGGMKDGFGGGFGDQGQAMATSSEECLIQINGGSLNITGLNDALDSNGNVEINGGELLVCGPSNGMDGALDYDLGAHINGGAILMLGSVGSTRGLDASGQAYAIEALRGDEGCTVSIVDADGNTLAQMQATLGFQSVLVSAPSIAEGSSYSVQIDSTSTTFTM